MLLADEPTGDLDIETGAEIIVPFERLNDAGRTNLMVPHEPYVAAWADPIEALRQLTDTTQPGACTRRRWPDPAPAAADTTLYAALASSRR